MVNFAGLGALGGGIQKGMQDWQKEAMLIQQAQAELDDRKRKIAANAAAGQGLLQQAPAQPPMPGQPSPPRQVPGVPAGAPQGAPPPGGLPQQGGVAPGAAPGGAGMPPPAPTDPETILRGIAQRIRSANPNIDPGTLMDAVERTVGQMKGIEPQIKDQMLAQVNAQRLQQSQQRLGIAMQRLTQQASQFDRRQSGVEQMNAIKAGLMEARQALFDAELAGQDPREIQRQRDALERIEAQITGREKLAGEAAERKDAGQAGNQLFKARMQEIRTKDNEIRELQKPYIGVKAPDDVQARIDSLQAARARMVEKMVADGIATKDEIIKDLRGRAGGATSKPKAGVPRETPQADTPPSPPKVGDVVQGHRFKGGDPVDPASWEKVGD